MFNKKAAVSGMGMILAAALTMTGCSSQGTSPAPAQTEAQTEPGAPEGEEKTQESDNRENTTAEAAGDGKAVKGGTVEAGPDIAVVDTKAGKLQGYISNGIYTYHGIPYAQAEERFTEAHETEPWEGVRMAFDYGAISPQVFQGSIRGGDFMDNNCQN